MGPLDGDIAQLAEVVAVLPTLPWRDGTKAFWRHHGGQSLDDRLI
jgi:hypothetical protein